MKPIQKTFTETGDFLFPLDAYSSKTSVNLISGTAVIESSISDFNNGATPVAFKTLTLPAELTAPISGLLITVSVAPCQIQILQSDV